MGVRRGCRVLHERGVLLRRPPLVVRTMRAVPVTNAMARVGQRRLEDLYAGATTSRSEPGQDPRPRGHPASLIIRRKQHVGRVRHPHDGRERLPVWIVDHRSTGDPVDVKAQGGRITRQRHSAGRPRRGRADAEPRLLRGPACSPMQQRRCGFHDRITVPSNERNREQTAPYRKRQNQARLTQQEHCQDDHRERGAYRGDADAGEPKKYALRLPASKAGQWLADLGLSGHRVDPPKLCWLVRRGRGARSTCLRRIRACGSAPSHIGYVAS